jgi:hypothetical protein
MRRKARATSVANDELWEWTGTDKAGKTVVYQTLGPSTVTEAAMLKHLQEHYFNLTITTLRRCDAREAKQSTGRVDHHAFQYGIWDEVMKEYGLLPKEERKSIAERFRTERLARLAGLPARNTYVPIRERVRPIVQGM